MSDRPATASLETPRPPRRPHADAIPDVAEIGSTWLGASAQRTGADTEAKLLMLGHAFHGRDR